MRLPGAAQQLVFRYIPVYTLFMWLTDLTSALNKEKVSYALVGGYAVALHGAVRGTLDIDLIIAHDKSSFENTETVLLSLGLQSRLPITAGEVFAFRKEYIARRNLIAWSFFHPHEPRKTVDIIITHDLKKLKTKTVRVENSHVNILAIGDLIAMKKQSGRPQDLADIAALKKLK
jgi:hypothetical protein